MIRTNNYTGKYADHEWVSYIVNKEVDTVEKLRIHVKETLGRDIIESTVVYKTPVAGLPYVKAYVKFKEEAK